MNEYFKHLNADPGWRKAIAEIGRTVRPIVPQYSLCRSMEEREMLIEEIKIKTGERKGFDLLFQLLTGENPT